MTVASSASTKRPAFLSQFFTFRGRSSRTNFWFSLLALVGVYMVVLNAILIAFSQSDALLDIQPVGVWLALTNWGVATMFYAFAAARRLHDRDKSSHWLWLFGFVPAAISLADFAFDSILATGPLRLVLSVSALILVAWGIVELGFFGGTIGPNRFGADPTDGT